MDSINTETRPRNFQVDKERVDRFENEIKRICGEIFIDTSPCRIDCEEATDLLLLEIKPVRIACRVREYRYWLNYSNEFTIRASRPNRCETELQKIISGWCDYNFYGFADETDTKLFSWFIGDLKVFRKEFNRALWIQNKKIEAPSIKWMERSNKDGSSKFLAFQLDSFPSDFIVKRLV